MPTVPTNANANKEQYRPGSSAALPLIGHISQPPSQAAHRFPRGGPEPLTPLPALPQTAAIDAPSPQVAELPIFTGEMT